MAIPNSMLAHALKEFAEYVVSADGIEGIILKHSLAAAAAATAAGFVPGAAGVIATGIALSFTLSMYYRICKEAGITLKKNLLKAIASIAMAEITAYLTIIIAAGTIFSLFPGIDIAGAIALGIINFAMVYVAGVLFLLLMVKLFKAGKNVEDMSKEELEHEMKGCATKATIKKVFKEAKKAHKEAKDDPAYSTDDVESADADHFDDDD